MTAADTVSPPDGSPPDGSPPSYRPTIVASDRGLPTVLFVDDEQHVLDGLRVSLRKLRTDFRFLYVTSADQAIAVLENQAVDMVISDMRMPERSGADLLEEVRFRFPDVVRYVLSGQAEDRLVRRSVAVVHRWLNKPCDHHVLVDAITEATGRRTDLYDPAVRRAIGTVDALPSHPAVYRALLDALSIPTTSLDQVVGLVGVDPAVTAKLLQWANSMFVDGRPVYGVRGALERIGVETLTYLSSANDVVRPLSSSEELPGFDTDTFYRHAREVAAVAAGLAHPDEADLVGTAALLSDIGLMVEAGHLSDRLQIAYRRALADGEVLTEVERQLFGRSHPDLAASLLSLWGLPRRLVDLVADSHGLPDPSAELPLSPLDAVRAGRLLVQRFSTSASVGAPHRLPTGPEVDEALVRWAAGVESLTCWEPGADEAQSSSDSAVSSA